MLQSEFKKAAELNPKSWTQNFWYGSTKKSQVDTRTQVKNCQNV